MLFYTSRCRTAFLQRANSQEANFQGKISEDKMQKSEAYHRRNINLIASCVQVCRNPDVSSLLLNSHGPHIRQKTLVIQDASAHERFSGIWRNPRATRWRMQKLAIFEDNIQSLQEECQRLQIRREFPELPLHWSIANSIIKHFSIPDFEPYRGAYGTPSFWRWRPELVDGYYTLKNSHPHLYVAHKSPDPVLFVLDMFLFCLANTFWLCSVHGMLMLSLINESTAPKQVVGVSRQVCDCTKTSIAYVSSVCTCLNQVWVLCAYCALTCCDIMQNDAIWARWVRLQAILNPESEIMSTVYPERWTDCALIRLF